MYSFFRKALFCAAVSAALTAARAETFDPKPWLDDLEQARAAFGATYANMDWAVFEREADLTALFEDARARIGAAGNEAEAKAAFNRLSRKLGDGHVVFSWPKAASGGGGPEAAPDRCQALGFDTSMVAAPLAAKVPGYTPVSNDQPAMFPAGLIDVNGRAVGVIKIGLFSPQGFPQLCADALKALAIPADADCDEACRFKVEDWGAARMTEALMAQLRALKAAGASALVVDLAGNGGGSEWAEAAVRTVTPVRLKSERMGFVRGEHWTTKFSLHEADIRTYAEAETDASDKAFLTGLADEIEAKRILAATPCDGAPFWQGRKPDCDWVGQGFFGSGFIASADPATLRGKPWADYVFQPMKFLYEEGVWDGPLIVLVDQYTASASEEFSAVLQDNKAAVVMGAPTAGAGCGHTDGGTPAALKATGGTMEVPDCVRFRADGSNEVMGIAPDILVGFRPSDGPKRLALRFAEKLSEALAAADALAASSKP